MKWVNCFRKIELRNEKDRYRPWYNSSQPEWDCFAEHTENGGPNFWSGLTSSRLVTNSLSCFLSRIYFNGFSFEFLSANHRVRQYWCWYIYIFSWPSAAILTKIWGTFTSLSYSFLPYYHASFFLCLCLFLSLSLTASNLLIISVSSFSLSTGWPRNLARKQLTTKTINQNLLLCYIMSL